MEQDKSKPTHIVRFYENSDPSNMHANDEIMYRMADGSGMKVGQRKGPMVVWGADHRQSKSRSFIDAEHCQKYFHGEVAKDDLKDAGFEGYEPIVKCENALGDSGLIIPSGIVNVPTGRPDFN